jgi:tRNA-specific 2-thiouridylase
MLFSKWLMGTDTNWIGCAPSGLESGLSLRAKVRYRQADQDCVVTGLADNTVKVDFRDRQKAVAPGQFVVAPRGLLAAPKNMKIPEIRR